MDKKKLIEAGFTEEQVASILKIHKEAVDGKFVPKHRFDEVAIPKNLPQRLLNWKKLTSKRPLSTKPTWTWSANATPFGLHC